MSFDPAPQTAFEEVPARVIACRHHGDYVQFTVREWKGGGTVSISGSYEAMATHAFSFGDRTFAQFLDGCSMDYMMNKLTSGKIREPDWEASCEAARRVLLERRKEYGREHDSEYQKFTTTRYHVSRYKKDRLLTHEVARDEYNNFFSGGAWLEGDEEKFRRIVHEGNIAAFGEEIYEVQKHRIRGWIPYFWNNFWLPFVEYLKANPVQPVAT